MVKLFWGAPANPGEMRFHVSTLLTKDGRADRLHFNRHEISGLYGIQIGKSFIGAIRVRKWGFSNIGREVSKGARDG